MGWVSRFTKMQGICAIVAAVCILTYIYMKQTDLRELPILGFIGPVIISLAVIYIVIQIPESQGKDILELCGTYSLEIYVVHCFITAGNRVILPKLGITHFGLNILTNMVMAVFIPMGCAWILKKWNLHTLIFRPAVFIAKKKSQ